MRRPYSRLRAFLLPSAAAIFGLVCTAAVYRAISSDQRARIADQFRYDASQRVELVAGAFTGHTDALESVGRFFEDSIEITSDEYNRFASAWVSPRLFSAIAWCVPKDGSDWMGAAGGLEPYYFVPTLEPFPALVSMLDSPEVRSAVAVAATSGRAAASAMVFLPWDRPQPAIALCRPVFSASDESGVRRFGVLVGFVAIPIVVQGAILAEEATGLPMTIRDVSSGSNAPYYSYSPRIGVPVEPGNALDWLVFSKETRFADRSWRIEVRASTKYVAAMDREADYFAIAGAIASLGLAALTLALVRGRESAEALAEASSAEFERFFTLSLDLFAIAGIDGVFRRLNPEWSAVLGRPLSELEGTGFLDFVHPEDVEATRSAMSRLAAGEEVVGFVNRYRAADGSFRNIEWRSRMAPDGDTLLAAARDITDRISMEDALRRSVAEKESLIKEVHHRVKNNMQVISSLLDLDAMNRAEPRLVEAAKEAQGRIRTMAMVHEQLYRRDSLSEIDLGDYLRELAGRVVGEYSSLGVRLSIDADSMFLDLDAAIPCGLAVNELLTNALKYACKDSGSAVRILACVADDGTYSIRVEDDGPGISADALDRSIAGETLGLSLVFGLAAQLGGELSVLPGPGARFELRFPYPRRATAPFSPTS